jgi:hypothetical protein
MWKTYATSDRAEFLNLEVIVSVKPKDVSAHIERLHTEETRSNAAFFLIVQTSGFNHFFACKSLH